MEKFARKCDATGRGMNQGYVVGDGELYFEKQSDLLIHLKEYNWIDCNGKSSKEITNEDELLEFFYNEDYYYYTEWDEIDDDVYYDADGNEYENE